MQFNVTLKEIIKNRLCTGCGTCISICPSSALKIKINKSEGIYIPEIDEKNCIDCKMCLKVCPGYSIEYRKLNEDIFNKQPDDASFGNYINCYVGHATDKEIRFSSSSGGLVTAMLIYALEKKIIDGALVTRMKKNNPLEPEPFIAETRDEILDASKSKYCPVPANIALKDILQSESIKKIASVGLPCHIHGIRKAQMINKILKDKIILHLGLFCANTISFNGTIRKLSQLGISKEDIIKLNYRGDGWPGGLSIYLKSNEIKNFALNRYYDKSFSLFKPYRCLMCSDHANELADISFGDAWNINEADNIGNSLIVSRNIKAEKILLDMLNENVINMEKIDINKAKDSQGNMMWKKNYLKSRMDFYRFLGYAIPNYDVRINRSPSRAYIGNLIYYLEHNLEKIKLKVRV